MRYGHTPALTGLPRDAWLLLWVVQCYKPGLAVGPPLPSRAHDGPKA